jgi:hypothetical protein
MSDKQLTSRQLSGQNPHQASSKQQAASSKQQAASNYGPFIVLVKPLTA